MDCEGLCTTATQLMVKENKKLEELQLSGCKNGVDDSVLRLISGLKNLSFLDISFCSNVTDEGFKHFEGKTYPLVSLVMNGLD